MENNNVFIATQTDKGFHIEFDNADKSPLTVTYDDINEFAIRYSQSISNGEDLELSEKDELMLSLWEMVLIPNKTIH